MKWQKNSSCNTPLQDEQYLAEREIDLVYASSEQRERERERERERSMLRISGDKLLGRGLFESDAAFQADFALITTTS